MSPSLAKFSAVTQLGEWSEGFDSLCSSRHRPWIRGMSQIVSCLHLPLTRSESSQGNAAPRLIIRGRAQKNFVLGTANEHTGHLRKANTGLPLSTPPPGTPKSTGSRGTQQSRFSIHPPPVNGQRAQRLDLGVSNGAGNALSRVVNFQTPWHGYALPSPGLERGTSSITISFLGVDEP